MSRQWDSRYIELAKLVASWSKDPSTQCGAVIIRQNNTLCSVGFNGFPRGMEDNPDKYNHRETKYTNIIHSERNAISSSQDASLNGYTVYAWPMPPCEGCTASLIQKGIKRVVCPKPDMENLPEDRLIRWKQSFYSAKDMLKQTNANIDYFQQIVKSTSGSSDNSIGTRQSNKNSHTNVNMDTLLSAYQDHHSFKWHLRFLSVAQMVSSWSKDPINPSGAVLAREDHTIASIGFNGYPQGVDDAPLINNLEGSRSDKLLSAELNSILFSEGTIKNNMAYTWPGPPNLRSTVHLIQEGIRHVICPDFVEVDNDVVEALKEVGGHVITIPIQKMLKEYKSQQDQDEKSKNNKFLPNNNKKKKLFRK